MNGSTLSFAENLQKLDAAIEIASNPTEGLVSPSLAHDIMKVLRIDPQFDFELRPGIIFVGSSRAGKDTVINEALELFPELQKVKSATTRDRREGEPEDAMVWMRGRHVDESKREYVKSLIAEYHLIENAVYFNDVYGLPISSLFQVEQGKIPIINTHPIAARKIQTQFSNYFSFKTFLICPENAHSLYDRIGNSDVNNKEQRLLGAAELIVDDLGVADYVAINRTSNSPKTTASKSAESIMFATVESVETNEKWC